MCAQRGVRAAALTRLSQLIRKLGASVEEKSKELSAFVAKYKIKVRSGGEQAAAASGGQQGQGVLVGGAMETVSE